VCITGREQQEKRNVKKDIEQYLAMSVKTMSRRKNNSVSGSYLQIFDEDYPGFCDNHKINFCPICGRKLS